jgi:anti-sigma factor RsiW
MESQGIHELTPAYALNALDPAEEQEYEEHLRRCDRCREELSALQETASLLAYAVEAPTPPPALRERIVSQAVAERGNVVPFRRRSLSPILGAVAAVAAAVAIGLGIWASSLSSSLSEERAARSSQNQALALFAQQGATEYPVSGTPEDATLVVARGGQAALVFTGLPAAPEGRQYQVWVIENDLPKPAGIFHGGGDTSVVEVEGGVPPGATVAVTVEDGPVDKPTTEPIAVAPTV